MKKINVQYPDLYFMKMKKKAITIQKIIYQKLIIKQNHLKIYLKKAKVILNNSNNLF